MSLSLLIRWSTLNGLAPALALAVMLAHGCSLPGTDSASPNDNTSLDGSNDNTDADGSDDASDDGDGNDNTTDGSEDSGGGDGNENGSDSGGDVARFAAFRLIPGSAPRPLDGEGLEVQGAITGAPAGDTRIVFVGDDGSQTLADIAPDGSFLVGLDEDLEYHIDVLSDGQFVAPVLSPSRDENDAGGDILTLVFEDGVVTVTAGPVETVDEPVTIDEDGKPVGLSDDIALIGLTDDGEPVETPTDDIDADNDGIPAPFDADKDGDGVIDVADDDVPALEPAPDPGLADGAYIAGAFVFNNLKLDMDVLTGAPANLFPHNDYAVVTIGWDEDPALTPTGFSVVAVEAVLVPDWSGYGFTSTIADWSVAPGLSGYTGYPASGSPWTGALYQEGARPTRWQVWVQSPVADAALAASYPDVVSEGVSIPLNWDLAGSGISANRPNLYRLRITYSNGAATLTRFTHAVSLFSFRTPGMASPVTLTDSSYVISTTSPTGAGHSGNPIVYPDTTTMGDILFEATPPLFDVSGTSGVMSGMLTWRFDIFYYNSTGQQIGSVLTTPTPHAYSGTPLALTLPESLIVPATVTADLNGDGVDDLQSGYTSDDVAAYKIDLTAQTLSASDNTGLFFYFVRSSAAGTFSGFTP